MAFIHQSVTEYLAANELARRYQASRSDPSQGASLDLKELLARRRWDYAILLTLSYLPPEPGDRFFDEIVKIDLTLALKSVNYLEIDRDAVVAKLLCEVIRQHPARTSFDYDWQLSSVIRHNSAIGTVHVPLLLTLLRCGLTWVKRPDSGFIEMGVPIKDEYLKIVAEQPHYNESGRPLSRGPRTVHDGRGRATVAAYADQVQRSLTGPCEKSPFRAFHGPPAASSGRPRPCRHPSRARPARCDGRYS